MVQQSSPQVARRIFIYDGKEYPDPAPDMEVDKVRQSWTEFFPELSNAETKESKRGEDTIYTFARRVGTKGGNRYYKISAEIRFWKKVKKTDTCWIWIGAKSEQGYGRFIAQSGRVLQAHRFAYELMNGVIPEGMELDHLCKNPSCVNPSHLEVVTHAENIVRSMAGKVNNPQTIKTHCPSGHPYDELNTYLNKQGKRECRICHRERNRNRRSSIARRRSPYYAGAGV